MTDPLYPSPFNGDSNVDELRSFFLPDKQFDGDTLWSFGTSLKSAYVNTFEFMNHAPIVQLWRDAQDVLQAVSRISLGTAEWFHLASPTFRTNETTQIIRRQADAALELLTTSAHWETVRYESQLGELQGFELAGYTQTEIDEVYMTMALTEPIGEMPVAAGVQMMALDQNDPTQMQERAMAQIDAFSDHEPTAAEAAWITRSLPHQLNYMAAESNPSIIAVDQNGRVLAFADPFYDRTNHIGEFEPVGTRKSSQRQGLSKAVMGRALNEMRDNGMTQAVVRTGFGNHAAIAAYESIGFEVTDRLVRLRKERHG